MSTTRAPLEHDIGELYRGPLADFVRLRNALAESLRAAGRADDAARVAALRKPSRSAWAVNRLFAREPEAMRGMIDAGTRARDALYGLLGAQGAHTIDALRDPLTDARARIELLRRRALAIVEEETGSAPGAAIDDRIGTDLAALAFSPASAEIAAREWLDSDLAPPSFEVIASAPIAPRTQSRRSRAGAARKARERHAPSVRERDLARAEAERVTRVEAARARAAAERMHLEREREARAAAARERAAAEVSALEAELDDTQREAELARRRATELARAVRELESRLVRARQALSVAGPTVGRPGRRSRARRPRPGRAGTERRRDRAARHPISARSCAPRRQVALRIDRAARERCGPLRIRTRRRGRRGP